MKLTELVANFDSLFQTKSLNQDPAMKTFIPMVYDPIGFDRKSFFEPDFVQRFNGLMIKGSEEVNTVFLSVFPTEEVLAGFLEQSKEGDILFLHHPIFMSSGDPKGSAGTFFHPIDSKTLNQIKEKKLSVYACHAPLDTNNEIGTGVAIVEALDGKLIGEFMPYGNGFAGKLCEVSPMSTDELIIKCQNIFDIPYCDVGGVKHEVINKIAIVPGGADNVPFMKEAEQLGAQCYLGGEIFNHIDSDRGRARLQEVKEYEKTTTLSLIATSHAASEYLVIKTQIKKYVEEKLKINVVLLPMSKWWI